MDNLNIQDETLETIESNSNRKYALVNTRALPEDAKTYELETFDKHVLLIFNQNEIDGFPPRLGTEKDVDSLTKTFENCGYEVITFHDLTKDAIFDVLQNFAQRDFSDYGCVAVAILTHGSNNGMLRAKDQLYDMQDVVDHFNPSSNPSLVTKPRIFIVQACRGTEITTSIPVTYSDKNLNDQNEEDLKPSYTLPKPCDQLILHSTYQDCVSYRDKQRGSWFIQSLCKKIDELSATEDLKSIITDVMNDVAINMQHEEYNKRTLEVDVNKQMPVMKSTLIRKLYLKKVVQVDNSRRRSRAGRCARSPPSTPATAPASTSAPAPACDDVSEAISTPARNWMSSIEQCLSEVCLIAAEEEINKEQRLRIMTLCREVNDGISQIAVLYQSNKMHDPLFAPDELKLSGPTIN